MKRRGIVMAWMLVLPIAACGGQEPTFSNGSLVPDGGIPLPVSLAPTALNGDYTGSLTVASNTCGTKLQSGTNVTFNPRVDQGGAGEGLLYHSNTGSQEFSFRLIVMALLRGQLVDFTGTSVSTIAGDRTFSNTASGTLSGNSLTVTETLTAQGSPCTIILNVAMTRR